MVVVVEVVVEEEVVVVLDVVVAVDVVVVAGAVVVVPRGRLVVVVVVGAGRIIGVGTVVVAPLSGSVVAVVLVVVDDDEDEVEVPAPAGRSAALSRRRSPRLSGEAVWTGRLGSPATAARMVAAQISAGYEPPVTLRPWTFLMGVMRSGWPTHTAVESWGTKPTNHASP